MNAAEHNLRHLRVLLAVVRTGSVTKASQACNISQPAVTQALKKLESAFGAILFERNGNGVFATPLGALLADRIERALGFIDGAATSLAPRLILTATTARLRALVAVAQTENFSLAARVLGIAQPTIHRAITQLEGDVGRALFKRTPYGSTPTRSGHLLAQAAQMAFSELAQAEMELAEVVGRGDLQITVGGMPLSRSYVLPQVIAQFQSRYPHVRVRVLEGPYETLLAGLRRTQIDFLFGALRDPLPVDDVVQTHLFDDALVVVAGPDHPLTRARSIDFAGAAHYPWIVAVPGTPARGQFDAAFKAAVGHAPRGLVETSSMILMRELMHQGPYLGCVSRLQAQSEIEAGLMTSLPLHISASERKIGLTTRRDWKPTQTQSAFLAMIQAAFQRAAA